MKRKFLLFAIISFTANAANAASTLASGPIWNPNQVNAACYLYNYGKTPVTVVGSIIEQGSGPVKLTVNDCKKLAAGAICAIAAEGTISSHAAHSCKFDISPNATGVRGAMDIRSSSTTLHNIELR